MDRKIIQYKPEILEISREGAIKLVLRRTAGSSGGRGGGSDRNNANELRGGGRGLGDGFWRVGVYEPEGIQNSGGMTRDIV